MASRHGITRRPANHHEFMSVCCVDDGGSHRKVFSGVDLSGVLYCGLDTINLYHFAPSQILVAVTALPHTLPTKMRDIFLENSEKPNVS